MAAVKIFSQLTTKQQSILLYIQHTCAIKDRPPTHREIMQHLSLSSVSVVAYNLKQLAEWGFVERPPDAPHSLWLTGKVPARQVYEQLSHDEVVMTEQQQHMRRLKHEITDLCQQLDAQRALVAQIKRIMRREGYNEDDIRRLIEEDNRRTRRVTGSQSQ